MRSLTIRTNRAVLPRSAVMAALIAFAGLTGAADRAYGWGMGHATQSKMVFDGLPKEIKDFFPADLRQEIITEVVSLP